MGKQAQINGRNFEQKLCNFYSKKGYYVIYNEKGVTGSQPCDLVVIRNNIATLIEAKNLTNKSGIFNCDRIEQNQLNAYKMYKSKQNSHFELAINWNGAVYLIDFELLQLFPKSIDLKNFTPNWRWDDEDTN